jgi:hypothetical protein
LQNPKPQEYKPKPSIKVQKALDKSIMELADLSKTIARESNSANKATADAKRKAVVRSVFSNAKKQKGNTSSAVMKENGGAARNRKEVNVTVKRKPVKKTNTKEPTPPAKPMSNKKEGTSEEESVDDEETVVIPDPDNESVTFSIVSTVEVPSKKKNTAMKNTERMLEGHQLESAAHRASQRAGPPLKPCDAFGCKHLGLRDFSFYGKVETASWLVHHLKDSGILYGGKCVECKLPAEKLSHKKINGMPLAYICEVGSRPSDKNEECKHWYCPGCLFKAHENMELVQQRAKGAGNRGVSTRTKA